MTIAANDVNEFKRRKELGLNNNVIYTGYIAVTVLPRGPVRIISY
jgi:hypothetical protein